MPARLPAWRAWRLALQRDTTGSMKSLLTLLTLVSALHGAVKLPSLISDHMVLQAGMPVRIWGTADPGEAVKVEFQGQSIATAARADGKWEAWLRPLTAAGPLEMSINGVVVHDVLVGEVWVGSGQSNMELVLQTARDNQAEIAAANYPLMRIFHVKKLVADQPASDVEAKWEVVAPGTIPRFSAVEYFFGRHLHQALHVPMGLIESDWGGTPAQSWISKEGMAADPSLNFITEAWQKTLESYPAAKQKYDAAL